MFAGAPYEANVHSDSTSHSKPHDEPMPAPTATVTSVSEQACADVPEATSAPISANEPPPDHASTESVPDLEPDILCLLGEEPVQEEKFGENVHKDIANRWADILVNGLKDETKKEILNIYSVPYNLKLIQAPKLNPEIRAAVNEGALRRDNILADKQMVLSSIITCVANTITAILQNNPCHEEIKCRTLKLLSDAGRLLCHTHYSETQTRKHFLLSCLNKEVKDNVKDLKRDHLLFGNDLQDHLRSMKAIIKAGTELKPAAPKPKLPPKNIQPKEHSSRALNWRGPPPPQSQPRRMPPRQNPTAGGRKQQPTRRATDRRAPRQYNQPPRR